MADPVEKRRLPSEGAFFQYRTNTGERRKPALGQYGELTVEQARSWVQEWLAQVRRGGDPAADKAAVRKAPTVKDVGVTRRSQSGCMQH